MPVDFKDNRYHKPSRSPHRSKHRDHRTYEKEKTERF